jgi:S1-C subfamily serine protease
VLHIFTGSHRDYHRPSDDVDKLNIIGMRRIGEFVGDIAAVIAGADERPVYQETKRPEMARGGSRPYLGSIPDFSREVEGYALMGVSPGSPAERAGIKEGDVIIQFGESKIGGLEDIDGALRKYKAGDSVPVVVLRGEDEQTISVTLDPPK